MANYFLILKGEWQKATLLVFGLIMLSVIYHKSFKSTGRKKCIPDEIYKQLLDYIEWFDSPDLIDRRETKSVKRSRTKRNNL